MKLQQIKTKLFTRALIVLLLSHIAICDISCQWVDNQTKAIECLPWDSELICKKETFYWCPPSSRWAKLVRCNEIDDIIIDEYDIDFSIYLKCCNE